MCLVFFFWHPKSPNSSRRARNRLRNRALSPAPAYSSTPSSPSQLQVELIPSDQENGSLQQMAIRPIQGFAVRQGLRRIRRSIYNSGNE
ncbi:unnamed protein product [Periconia digitata]|uniref:Uncharacterized protein n=1 Tax=Periconia digitata TaxID=1303443 RepID=A0A9W4UJ97_9PLEO|nr:unnamed protein product [Periconia digitata]